jgi:hypothetical protein
MSSMTRGPRRPPRPYDDDRLPLRWLVIIAIAAVAGIFVGTVAGRGYGITTAVVVAGGLHAVVGSDRRR